MRSYFAQKMLFFAQSYANLGIKRKRNENIHPVFLIFKENNFTLSIES